MKYCYIYSLSQSRNFLQWMGHFKMEPSIKSLNKRNQLGPNSISKAHSLEKFKDTSKKCSLSQFGSIFQWSKHQGCIIPLPFPSHFRTSPTVQGERPVVGPFRNNGRGVFGRCGLCLSPCLGLIRHPLSRCSNFWPASRVSLWMNVRVKQGVSDVIVSVLQMLLSLFFFSFYVFREMLYMFHVLGLQPMLHL